MEISEKLLSEVLELDVTNYKYPSFGTYIDYSKLYVIYKKENIEYSLLVNIYELAHKCKAWAYNQGYLIGLNSRQGITLIDIKANMVIRYISFGNLEHVIRFELNLCQWILDNKKVFFETGDFKLFTNKGQIK